MPRGHKGPPQDSIDSILLAISRRDDIDADTLAHYFERLDEEWADGARDKVLHLLRSSDSSANAAAVLVLSELATDFDLEELEGFVADPTVSDMAKLSLAPILKELGSDLSDDGMIEYLKDPAAAVLQMQSRLLELVGQSEMGVESILEDVISMPLERKVAFVGWLGSSKDPRAATLLIPLLENQPSKFVLVVLDALEQLGTQAALESIPALNHLISTTSNRAVKQYARSVLGRLTMHLLPGTDDMALTAAQQRQVPPHEARVSFIDGSGAQLIMLSWQRPDGLLKGVNVLYQDQWGIKDCYGIDEMDERRWSELVKDLDEQGFGSFQVPFEYGCALVLEARAQNKRMRHKVPIAYTIWRPYIEVAGPTKKALASATALESATLNDELMLVAQRGDELYHMPEFLSWTYEPMERVEPYMTRYWAYYSLFDSPLLEPSKKSRKKKIKHEGNKAVLEGLIQEALCDLVDEKWRLTYERRLRRQAQLLRFAGREQDVLLVSAVATALHPDSDVPVQEQAFLRAMMRLSIEQGPWRVLVESFHDEAIDSRAMNLFHED